MVINFRACGISQDAHILARISMLIIIKNIINVNPGNLSFKLKLRAFFQKKKKKEKLSSQTSFYYL